MQVVLMERIEKLGQMGDEVSVKPGYARNFLLPKGKAVRATAANKARFEKDRAQLEADNLKQKKEAEAVGGKMDGVTIILVRQAGDAGQLYGSVNARDIADQLTTDGFTVSRQQVRLDTPIKTLGLHDVVVSLHPEVTTTITTNVARSAEEAEIQASTGKAMMSIAEQEAEAEAEDAANEAVLEQAETMFEEGVDVGVSDEADAAEENTDEAETSSDGEEEKSE
jgi:large subunit ribosomal protein L9